MTEDFTNTPDAGVTVHHIHTPISRAATQVLRYAAEGMIAERELEEAGGWSAALDPALQDFWRDADVAWSCALEELEALKGLSERSAADGLLKRIMIVFHLVLTAEDETVLSDVAERYRRFAGLFRMDRARLSAQPGAITAYDLLSKADKILNGIFDLNAFGGNICDFPDMDPDPFIPAASAG